MGEWVGVEPNYRGKVAKNGMWLMNWRIQKETLAINLRRSEYYVYSSRRVCYIMRVYKDAVGHNIIIIWEILENVDRGLGETSWIAGWPTPYSKLIGLVHCKKKSLI